MECKFCGEKDQSKLFISTFVIDGKITSDIVMCFGCYWMEKFGKENGKYKIGEDIGTELQSKKEICRN